VVALAAYGAYVSLIRLANANQARILAVELADEQFEAIRNMPFVNVGLTDGIPQGSSAAESDLGPRRLHVQCDFGHPQRQSLDFDGASLEQARRSGYHMSPRARPASHAVSI
jgi:hypothetical protein